MTPSPSRTVQPQGPFDLLHQNQYFSGWPTLADQKTVVMAFPVEGWSSSAAVLLSQNPDRSLSLAVHGTTETGQAVDQALAALSLDVDGTGWEQLGERDPVLHELQDRYSWLRPTLFHSPYEAAAHFVIGHRITMQQGRKIRRRMAEELGDTFVVDDQSFASFPRPQVVLTVREFPGLSAQKIERLHAVATAALDGWLDRTSLRELGEEAALAKLETLPGVGAFFSQGILHRGAGSADGFTHDDLTYHAIRLRYGLGEDASRDAVLQVAERWRPFRMWAVVLHHIWLRETGNLPKRSFGKP